MELLHEIQAAYMNAETALNPNSAIYDYFNEQVASVYHIIGFCKGNTQPMQWV